MAAEEGDALEAAAAQARRVLRENEARADKLQNAFCILQGKQDAAKRALEDAVARHGEAVSTWKAAFRQLIDAQFVQRAKLLHDQLGTVQRATVGLHTALDRLEALRFSPAAVSATAAANLLARCVTEGGEVPPDLLLEFAFHEVPADRWARSRLAVGYLQTGSLAPTDLTLEEVAADGLMVTLQASSRRPHDAATVTHLAYSVLDATGAEVTEVVWVDCHDGRFTVVFRAAAPGPHVVSVYLYSVHINGSPLRVRVAGGADAVQRRDAVAQTDGDDAEFVGWVRSRLERELALPGPPAAGSAVLAPAPCRPVAGGGRLRRPAASVSTDDNNNEPLFDWNAHRFDRAARVAGTSQQATLPELAAERIRAMLTMDVKTDAEAGAEADAYASAGADAGAGAGVSAGADTGSGRGSRREHGGGDAPRQPSPSSGAVGKLVVPPPAAESLRRPVTQYPPSVRVTVKQEAGSSGDGGGNWGRTVREVTGPEEARAGSPSAADTGHTVVVDTAGGGAAARRVELRKGERQDENSLVMTLENSGKPQTRAPAPVQGADGESESGRAAPGGQTPPAAPRVPAPRRLRTRPAAGPFDLARGPVTAQLDLLLRPTPPFKHPIGVTVAGDTLFVADTGNDTVRAFAADGTELPPAVPKLRRPSALAALSGGRLAVRYDQGVRVYAVDDGGGGGGRLLQQLGAGLLRRPFGLAVTAADRLVTVDSADRRALVHVFDAAAGADGCLLHSVDITRAVRQPETAKLYFVAASKTRVAVTDLGNNVVLLLNWEGRLLSRVGGGPEARLSDPAGVVLDGAGNLLVADSKHHRLLVFSADGEPRGPLVVSHGLSRPSGVCLHGGQLLVLNYWEHTAHRYQLTAAGQH